MFKVKIVIVGPCESGKTTLANFLSDATESVLSAPYRPTHVLRILEFDTSSSLNVNNRYVKADVELWDSSGNHGFEASWAAIRRDAHGIVFVFDPHSEEQARELEVFYAQFVEKSGLSDSQCIVFANVRSNKRGSRGAKLPSQFNRIPQLEINIEEEGNRVRNDFNTFLSSLISNLSERHDQEEMNIINMKN